MDSASIADAVDHAAAMLAQAASEVYVADEEYYPMADVKWLARIALFWAQLPWLKIAFAFATLVAVVGAYVATHRDALVARFDSFVTNKVLSKMQARLAGAVSLGKVRVRPFSGTVIVEEFTLGNPPTAEFNAPYLVSMQRVHVKCNPLSMAGVRGNSSSSLLNVGTYGYYWSSTVSGPYARNLTFYSGGADMFTNLRAYGISVRCLKD